MIYGVVLLLLTLLVWNRIRKPRLRRPPGPAPWPILGNVFDFPSTQPWLAAHEWSKEYGPMTFLNIFGQGVLILNTLKVAVDLLEKRGAMYSDRPRMVMAVDLCGCDSQIAFMSYNEEFSRQRRLMQRALTTSNVRTFEPLLLSESRLLLKNLALSPSEYVFHIRRYANAMALSVIYGLSVETDGMDYITMAENGLQLLSNNIAPSGSLWAVDIFPFLRTLPSWFPFASFKRKANEWKPQIVEFVEKPYAAAKQKIRDQTAVSSFCSALLGNVDAVDAQLDNDIMWSAHAMYASSADSTVTILSHLILAMIKHPNVLKRAQQEIYKVVGSRLPTFEDRPRLSYVECIMNETMRWTAPLPLCLPHTLSQDDEYQHTHLPKGTLVIPNILAMLRDEELFPDAEAFIPERYEAKVPEDVQRRMNPRQYIFGFGRRRCPGVNLVESSLWLSICSILAALDISRAVDQNGKDIEPEAVYENLVFRQPNKFPCEMHLRPHLSMNDIC